MHPWLSHPFPEILDSFLTQESCKSAKNSWSYKHLKFKFVRMLKPEASKWQLWEKPHRPSFLLFLNCFRANQVGFKQVFDNLAVKHIDALRKQIQSLADYVLNHCFWTYVM